MRMLMHVKFPHSTYNEAIKDGTAGEKTQRILEEIKPEAVYFTECDGHRCAILIVNLADPSMVPALAEPWFLLFEADVRFHIVMSPEDLERAGLGALGEKWC